MKPGAFISIVIPSFNSSQTISHCLQSILSSDYKSIEVIVVDDLSDDNSPEIISRFPCRLIRLERHCGTSTARNTGAINSRGEFILFMDSDCVLKRETLSMIDNTIRDVGRDVVIGGTYSTTPYDQGFFNQFQAVFVNYFETKKPDDPDYVAAHAMVINREVFIKSGGFPERFMPIIEDVEFSHRLKRQGCRLIINPRIEMMHIFNFNLIRSMRNAIRKSIFWSMYSIKNRDALKDSGTASLELKTSVTTLFLNILLLLGWVFIEKMALLYISFLLLSVNIFINRGLFRGFYKTGGFHFFIMASLYYMSLYSLSVGIGAIIGMMRYLVKRGKVY